MFDAIMILVILTAVGFIFGLVLAFANKKLAVKTNPLIEEVEEVLPKGQCGACGFAGCAAYAEAVVLSPDVSPSLCVPGKEAVAQKVAELTGKAPEKVEPRIALVRCQGTRDAAVQGFKYEGVQDCVAAALVQGGPKGCKYGCMGFGTCTRACLFDALHMGPDGLPVVDPDKCTGCGSCEKACPKHVISMLPLSAKVEVGCNSLDKGPAAKKLCSTACIGCGICARNCPYKAIEVKNNLAVVNHAVCAEQCTEPVCYQKCPTSAIHLKRA